MIRRFFEAIVQRVDTFIGNHEDKAKAIATDIGGTIRDILQVLLSKESVLLAFLTEQIKLSKYAIFTICVVAAFMTVAFLLKRLAGRYAHIKSLAESFLSAVDIKGVLKNTVTGYVKAKCKTEKKGE